MSDGPDNKTCIFEAEFLIICFSDMVFANFLLLTAL